MVYPLHYAVENNAPKAVVMELLSTRPNEAKRLDKVRGRWVPMPSHTRRRAIPVAPPSVLCQRHILVRSF